MTPEIGEVVGASSLGEVCWVEHGQPRARGVVALMRQGSPVLALTYADELLARTVGGCSRVSLALSEPRSTGSLFRPVLVTGTPRLREDPRGEVFVSELLVQELHRFPPARLYADSPLLMREHWWYLPRLLVEIEVDTVEAFPPRIPPHDHLLAVADGAVPVVRVAGILKKGEGTLELDVPGPVVPTGPAVLFGQDASFPDLERWSQWSYRGSWDGERFAIEEAPARIGLGPPLGLLQRWKRERALERRCVRAIPRR